MMTAAKRYWEGARGVNMKQKIVGNTNKKAPLDYIPHSEHEEQ
jgi:hypothetical protein